MSGNPLFISIFSRATSQPLTSILRTQRETYSETYRHHTVHPPHSHIFETAANRVTAFVDYKKYTAPF